MHSPTPPSGLSTLSSLVRVRNILRLLIQIESGTVNYLQIPSSQKRHQSSGVPYFIFQRRSPFAGAPFQRCLSSWLIRILEIVYTGGRNNPVMAVPSRQPFMRNITIMGFLMEELMLFRFSRTRSPLKFVLPSPRRTADILIGSLGYLATRFGEFWSSEKDCPRCHEFSWVHCAGRKGIFPWSHILPRHCSHQICLVIWRAGL